MTLYHAIETLLVPLIVLACTVSVVARYAPITKPEDLEKPIEKLL